MRIDKIELCNFGSYAGVCEFDLRSNNKGNIVLIGGKNGAGKTTLFTAIQICLYGHIHNSHQHNMMESWKKELRQLQDIPGRCCNVGCMMPWMDYTPRTIEELEACGALTE